MQYYMKVPMNMVWNEDASEYSMNENANEYNRQWRGQWIL